MKDNAGGGTYTFTQSLLALSAITFLGNPIGKGFYVRGDIGRAAASEEVKGSSLLPDGSSSDSGVGILASIGYGLPISNETRILFGLTHTINRFSGDSFSTTALSIYGLW